MTMAVRFAYHRFPRLFIVVLSLLAQVETKAQSAKMSRQPSSVPFAAAEKAKEYLGAPYQYGGATPAGFDCSGLVRFSYAAFGVNLPHGTVELRKVTRMIRKRELKKGDLLFFNEEGKKASHVALYLGNGRFIHAPSTGGKVRVDSISKPHWAKALGEIRRVRGSNSRNVASEKR
jgi:murein DD-endopeptidase